MVFCFTADDAVGPETLQQQESLEIKSSLTLQQHDEELNYPD